MTKFLKESNKKDIQLSNLITFFKSIISDTRKAITLAEKSIDLLENKCQYLKNIISAKDRKIITLINQILFNMKYNDVTIKSKTYSSNSERDLQIK